MVVCKIGTTSMEGVLNWPWKLVMSNGPMQARFGLKTTVDQLNLLSCYLFIYFYKKRKLNTLYINDHHNVKIILRILPKSYEDDGSYSDLIYFSSISPTLKGSLYNCLFCEYKVENICRYIYIFNFLMSEFVLASRICRRGRVFSSFYWILVRHIIYIVLIFGVLNVVYLLVFNYLSLPYNILAEHI